MERDPCGEVSAEEWTRFKHSSRAKTVLDQVRAGAFSGGAVVHVADGF
ncbi:MAG TPA: hypothetical protein VMB04_18970 [Mycobacterium sp.]|nr:hypothetical protein [Mycobacterium sp.]